MTDKAELQRLVAEAMAETPDPRAGRCWFTHRWSMWQVHETRRLEKIYNLVQTRRCCRCGFWQVAEMKAC